MKKANLIALSAFILATATGSFEVKAESILAGKKTEKSEKCYSKEDPKKVIPCAEAHKQVDLYPNATRIMPEYPQSKIQKDMMALSKTNVISDPNEVVSAAQRVYSNSKASTYEKALAAYMLSSAYRQIDKTNYKLAIEYAIIAIQLNVLDNNLHYQLMDVLSYMLLQQNKYEESLQYSTKLIKETSTENITTLQVQGNALYRLGRYTEAIAPLKKAYVVESSNPNLAGMLFESYTKTNQKAEAAKIKSAIDKNIAKAASVNPDDKVAQSKLLSTYASSGQYEKAALLFDDMNAKGLITTVNEYEAGYISYYNWSGHEEQTIKIINEGLAKKIIPESDVMYQLLGHANYMVNNSPGAIEAWTKGAALSSNGEQNLLLAQIYREENEYTKSKAEAQKALNKGVKNKEQANKLLN